jgi:methylated-DNA-[protein]-cysteine S-methyltransferase
MPSLTIPTPTGPFTIAEEQGQIIHAEWGDGADDNGTALLQDAAAQVTAYFEGHLRQFDLPLAPAGSDLQRRTCGAMLAIPFGETRTYGEIAADLGASAQAIGQACGGNPIPLIIPCHRVLAANNLGGFSGRHGIESKVWLLKHEGAASLLI